MLLMLGIGRRYARNDEIGTPFAITVDFETPKDGTVTLRERDSTHQIRATIEVVVGVVQDLVEGRKTWPQIEKEFGVLAAVQESE
jgi:glycyl-tRNA synthetase